MIAAVIKLTKIRL